MDEEGIVWTEDGPEGAEDVRFSADGVRIVLLRPNGALKLLETWDPAVYGGVVPQVGDTLSTLWVKEDQQDEHYVVTSRHYIGEFAGENCWWLVVERQRPTDREAKLFDLAREVSAERGTARRASLAEASTNALAVAAELKRSAREKRRAEREAAKLQRPQIKKRRPRPKSSPITSP